MQDSRAGALTKVLFGSVRKMLTFTVVLALIGMNVASLISDRVHGALFDALETVAAVGGAALVQKLATHSPTAKKKLAAEAATRDLQKQIGTHDAKLRDLERQHKALGAKHAALEKSHATAIESQRKAAVKMKELATRAKSRLTQGVVRKIGALAGEAVPVVGTAVAVGVTALEVLDACESLNDWNQGLAAHEQPPEDVAAVCGVKVPTSSAVLSKAAKTWRESAAKVREEIGSRAAGIELPHLQAPSAKDVGQAVCPVLRVTGLCP